jgi:hypothetical protein
VSPVLGDRSFDWDDARRRHLDGESFAEIGRSLGVGRATVRKACGVLQRALPPAEPPSGPEGPTIQAVDTDDETLYILTRPGKEPVVAHWPQPLEKLCPEAVRVAAHRGGDVRRTAPITVALSWNQPGYVRPP